MFILLRWVGLALSRFLWRRAKVALRNFIIVQGNVFVRSLFVAGVGALVNRRVVTVPSTRLHTPQIESGSETSVHQDASSSLTSVHQDASSSLKGEN